MAAAVPGPVVKIHKRLLPLFVLLVVLCYLDRTSLAFAALQLCEKDWFNAKVYGLGSGVFYAGYVVFQVPSNLILARLGARTWLPLITAAWGAVASLCVFIRGPTSFYLLRLALGVAEAGAFPAMWHVCGQFYPATHITLAYSVLEASVAVSQIIAAPVAAGLLQLSGVGGLAGWQHLFLAEGLATIVLAGILRWRLPGSVLTSDFLDAEDKLWLLQQLQPSPADAVAVLATSHGSGQCGAGQDNPAALLLAGAAAAADVGGAGDQQQLQPERKADDSSQQLTTDASAQQQQQQQQQQQVIAHGSKGNMCHAATEQQRQQGGAQGHEQQQGPLPALKQLWLTLTNRLILYLMLFKALKDMAFDGLIYWLPLLVHALLDHTAIGTSAGSSSSSEGGSGKHCGGKDSQLRAVLLTAIPFGTAAVVALIWGHSSEVRQERRKHIGVPLLLGGAVFATLPWLLPLASHVPAFVVITAAVVASDATAGPFWTWVHLAAAPGTEAVSLAAVNSVGKAGGFLGPLSFGLILHATGSYVPSILLVAAVLVCGGVLALCYGGDRQQLRYSKLQEGMAASQDSRSESRSESVTHAGQQQQRQRQEWRPRQQPAPELELLRGSSGDSQYSS